MLNTLLQSASLLADENFLKLLDELETNEPTPSTAAPSLATSPEPNAKELPGFYTAKATQYTNNYDNDFLAFSEKELPGAYSYWVMDCDLMLVRARGGALMFLELKRNGYECKTSQARTIAIINELMSAGVKTRKGKVRIKEAGKFRKYPIEWKGYNVLQLSNDSFENSTFIWNGKPISRENLILLLSMED